ncbi:MAG: hypothetical protein ACLFV3_11085 [Phycisphaeraceae bacterium]
MSRQHRLLRVWFCCVVGFAGLVGCADRTPALSDELVRELAELSWPEDAQLGPALELTAARDDDAVEIANRSEQEFSDVQLWLNRQYVRPLPGFAPGERRRFRLDTFVNSFREPFPTGGLLTPEKARPVLMAHLYDPATDTLYPLTVLPN